MCSNKGDPAGGQGVLLAVTFANAERGWMTGVYSANGIVFLRLTTDGGRRWRSERLPLPPGVTLAEWSNDDDIEVAAPQLFGPRGRQAILPVWVGYQLEIYHSGDSGLHWTAPRIPPNAPVCPGLDNAGADFINRSNGWAWSGFGSPMGSRPGALETTTNGGRTWRGTRAAITGHDRCRRSTSPPSVSAGSSGAARPTAATRCSSRSTAGPDGKRRCASL